MLSLKVPAKLISVGFDVKKIYSFKVLRNYLRNIFKKIMKMVNNKKSRIIFSHSKFLVCANKYNNFALYLLP